MLDRLKKTLRHSIVYSLGNISTKIVGLILLPLYLDYLTTEDYGILAILEVSNLILVGIFDLNLPTALLRWGAETKDERGIKKLIFTSTITTFVVSVLLCVFLIPLSGNFSSVFFDSPDYSNYFILLFLSTSIGIFNNIPLTIARLNEKPIFYTATTTFRLIIILTLNIYFIVSLGMGVEGIILSQVIGHAVITLLCLPMLFKNIVFSIDYKVLWDMLKYSFPLIFAYISSTVLTLGDRYLLNYFLSLSSVGIYSLGYKIASVLKVFLIQSFQIGFIPFAFKMIGQKDSQRFFSKILTYFVFLLVIGTLILSLFGKEAIELLTSNREYDIAYTLIPIISLSFILLGMMSMFLLGFHYTKRTTFNAYIVISGAVLNIALNLLLIPLLDFYGSAVSMVISFLIMTMLSYKYSQKVYFIPYEIKKISLMILLGSAYYFLSLFLNDLELVVRVLIKIVMLASFPFLLYHFKFYEAIELLTIKRIASHWNNPSEWMRLFK
ncbi:MAG: oligosaccharide flippase family protein [Bacteroidetes bacterium]|nr:oligosaccharide flippase family protein [Bacteroidota bacterium]MBU1677526.1 oligosaccharide flippase family protein [Bacteroidota bacterium]MBU2507132.1 oligosaccharide flippase family protein [Bacteroidota bacterium]